MLTSILQHRTAYDETPVAHNCRAVHQRQSRANRYDSGKTLEVIDVERQHMRHAVNVHGSNEPGIVALLAGNAVGCDKPFPFLINLIGVIAEP